MKITTTTFNKSAFILLFLLPTFLFSQYTLPSSGNNSISVCSGTLMDPGGAGNYANNTNSYTVLNPTAGSLMSVSGSLDVEGGYDYLTIYDGVGTAGTILYGGSPHGTGTVCNPFIVPVITSISGALTVKFYSDASNNCSGFQLNINCITCRPITGVTDLCVGAISQLTTGFSSSSITGGTISNVAGYRIHKFTSSGTFTVPTGFSGDVDVLVVAGGGGGGSRHAGGGGAGGLIYSTGISVIGNQTITVGNGGTSGVNGQNSTFAGITAIGGGYGSTNGGLASTGGSGGGGSNGAFGGSGTAGQGNKGGNQNNGNGCCAARGNGGGGAGSPGANTTGIVGSSGGVGLSNSITGSPIFYAGGGGGGLDGTPSYAGGNGGGGSGGTSASVNGINGTVNTGGGGGGGGANGATSGTGGTGGSGVVILRYLIPGTWSSSNAAIASVSPTTGVVTAVAPGTVTITYTPTTGCISTTKVVVGSSNIASLATSPTTQEVCVGSNASITVTESIAACKYRLNLKSAYGGVWHGIQEIRGKNAAGTYQTLTATDASSATYSADVFLGDYDATQAFDGVYNSATGSGVQWLTPMDGSSPNKNWQNYNNYHPFYTPEWIEWTSPTTLTDIDIYNGRYATGTPTSCYKDYSILVSYDNGVNWSVIKKGTLSATPGLNTISLAPTYTWKKGGTNVGSGKTLNLTGVTAASAGIYTVEIDYGCGIISLNSNLNIRNIPAVPDVSASNPIFCTPNTTNLIAKGMAPSDQAVNFSTGSFSYIDVPNNAIFNFAGNNTIEAWIKPIGQLGEYIVYNKENQYEVKVNTDGTLQWAYERGQGWAWINTGAIIPTNTWTHIAVSHNATTGDIKSYVNGYLIHTGTIGAGALAVTTNQFRIGNRGFNSPFYGSIDNVRVWSSERTQVEVKDNMYLETPTSTTGLVANYPLNGNGNALTGTNGTLTNAGGASWVNPNFLTYTWSGGPSLPTASTNETQITSSISTAGTHNYTVIATESGLSCSSSPSAAVSVITSTPSTAPTASSGGGNYCHGNVINLTQSGGTNGTNAVNVWYAASGQTVAVPADCPEGFMELWNQFKYENGGFCYYLNNNTSYNLNNGIINLEAQNLPGGDPFIWMYPLPNNTTFDADTYKHVNVRYKVTNYQTTVPSLPARMSVLFTKHDPLDCGTTGAYTTSNYQYPFSEAGLSGSSGRKDIINDGQWHVVSFPYTSVANWNGDITGLRLDYYDASPHNANNGSTMEVDFITVSKHPMIGEGASITLTPGDEYYPTQSTTYYAKKVDNCGSSGCKTETVILPPITSSLAANNESATCNVLTGEKVHFYHSSGRLITTVKATSGDLGSTTATAYVEATPLSVPACEQPTIPSYFTATMARHWVINPTTQSIATVFLPFLTTEYNSLVTSANGNSNVNDNIASESNIELSKYSGPANVNSSYLDNCVSALGSGGTTLHTQVNNGAVSTPIFMRNIATAKHVRFDITSFSEFWLHGSISSPLPVKLTNFSATCENEVTLSWTTASEQNSDRFIVEKSRDGLSWNLVGELDAAGNSNTVHSYNLKDENSWTSISYYRLKQIDFNGAQEVYGPISVSCSENGSNMTVYPNPNDGKFTIEIYSNETHPDANLTITDLTGKIITSQKVNITNGTSQIVLDHLELQMGTYLVTLQDDNLLSIGMKPVKVMVSK